MKDLNSFVGDHLNESILDDPEEIMDRMGDDIILKELHNFFKTNYHQYSFHYGWDDVKKESVLTDMLNGEVIDLENKIVSCETSAKSEVIKLLPTATQLLPDGWKFGRIKCHLDISGTAIKDLSQAPKEISGNLYMSGCSEITSFVGNVVKVKGNISCKDCPKLTSWEGLPEVKGKVDSKGTPLPEEQVEETPESCPTLFDCMKRHIKNFAFERRLGPTHYDDVMTACKAVKKKYKPTEIRSTIGNKANPAVLANVVFGIAPHVEIDYSLPVEKRITDAFAKFKKLYSDAIDGVNGAGGLSVYFEPDPVIFKRYEKSGTKSMYTKQGVGLAIEIYYTSGHMTINLDEQSPLFM